LLLVWIVEHIFAFVKFTHFLLKVPFFMFGNFAVFLVTNVLFNVLCLLYMSLCMSVCIRNLNCCWLYELWITFLLLCNFHIFYWKYLFLYFVFFFVFAVFCVTNVLFNVLSLLGMSLCMSVCIRNFICRWLYVCD
jgi:hypothetical protein